MIRLLALLAFLVVVASASATTTTTTLAAGASWVCSVDYKSVQPMFYESIGHCTSTGAYTTSGGDALGSAATAAATAQALCGSGNATLVAVFTDPSPTGAIVPSTCHFDMTTFKYVCAQQATASASTAMIESTISSVVMAPFKFIAICK